MKKKIIISSIIFSNIMAQAPQNINNYLYSEQYQKNEKTNQYLKRLKNDRENLQTHRTSAVWMKAFYDAADVTSSALPLGTGIAVGALTKLGQRVTDARVAEQELIYTQKVKDIFFEMSQNQKNEFLTILEMSSTKDRAEALVKLASEYGSTDESLKLNDEERQKLAYQLGKNSLEVAKYIAQNQNDFIQQQGEAWREFREEVSEDFDKVNETIQASIAYDIKQDNAINNLSENINEFQERYNNFAANLKAKIASQEVDIARNTDRIRNNRSQITINREMIEDLSDTVFDNKISIDELENSVTLLQDDVAFNQVLLFDDMSAAQKLVALDNPRFLSEVYPNGIEREMIKEKLELVKTRVEIAQQSQAIAQGASDILKIADNLGFKGKNSKEIKEILQYGIAAANITASIAGGNYLGAAVAITGLFGKSSGPSAEELRHQQIMETLGIIDEKLNQVLENQKVIYEKLGEIQKSISDLSSSIKEVEKNLLTEVGYIQGDLAFILNMLNQNDQTVRKLDLCNDFLKSRSELNMHKEQRYESFEITHNPLSHEQYFNFNKGYFIDWKDLEDHYTSFTEKRDFSFKANCMYPLQTLFSTSKDRSSFYRSPLLMGSYVKDSTSLNSQVLAPVYNPLLKKLLHLYPISYKINEEVELNKALKAYMTLSTREFHFLSSYDEFSNHLTTRELSLALEESDDINSTNVEMAMRNILHPPKVIKYGHMLLETLPYHDLIESDDKLLSQEEINRGNFVNGSEETFNSLKKLIPIVNSAMAQQQVFSGMLVLERLHQDLLGTNGATEKNLTLNILKNSPLLLKNYIRYRIYSDLVSNRRSDSLKGSDSIETVFMTNLNTYTQNYDNRTLKLRELKRDLGSLLTNNLIPKPASLQELKYLQTSDYYSLRDLKMEIYRILSYYPLNTEANIDLISYSLPYSIFKNTDDTSSNDDDFWDFWN